MLKRIIIYSSAFFLFFGIKAIAQPCPSPDVKCLAVLPGATGDVNLTWATPPDPSVQFVAYHIFRGTSPAALLPLTTIAVYTQTSYLDINAGANGGRIYYAIQTESLGGVTLPAIDTLSTIFLDVTPLTAGVAKLTWNEIATPNVSTSTGVYSIYREYPAGVWNLLTTTMNLSHQDTINICNTWINYRIAIADLTGCTSVSNVDGAQFFDVNVPATPLIDTVSVNGAGLATLSWALSSSADVKGYIIYQNIGGFWLAIDTIWSSTSTFYTNLSSSASNNSEQYAVSSIDSCGNVSPQSNFHRTLHLTKVYNKCAKSVYLHWNYYSGWNANSYQVYRSINASSYMLINTNAANDTTFSETALSAGNNYCYLILAQGAGKTSSSNRQCFVASYPSLPAFTYMKSVSVASQSSVTINTYQDNSANAKEYRIERSVDGGSSYNTIGAVPFSGSATISFSDGNTDTKIQSYFYRVIAVDSCGTDAQTSNAGETILLKGVANFNLTNTLSWNDYSTWLGAVSVYNIYRAVDGVWNTTPIGTIPYGNATIYTDDVSAFLNNNTGGFSYYVEAIEGVGNPYGFAETSISNIEDVSQTPKFFVPNAFVPNGLNSIFIPVSGFIDNADYKFSIFTRLGVEIFSTSSPDEGWDGTHSGKIVQQGVYVYLIRIKNSVGEYIEQRGTVTLIGGK